MFDYALYFLITLFFSTLFGVVGLGSSLVLIPLFTILGIDFNFAKAIGLFANGITTVSITLNNIKKKTFRFKDIFFLAVFSGAFAMLGAYTTKFISQDIVQILFILFIFLSILLLYFGHINPKEHSKENFLRIWTIIMLVAFVSGLIGVGGGAVYLPLLLYFGNTTKESIVTTSALIPIVSFSAFLSYTTFIEIDWIMLSVVAFGALAGGFLGNTIMHKIKNDKYLKTVISLLLIIIALAMIITKYT